MDPTAGGIGFSGVDLRCRRRLRFPGWLTMRLVRLAPPPAHLLTQQWVIPFGLGLTALALLGALGLSAKRPLARLLQNF